MNKLYIDCEECLQHLKILQEVALQGIDTEVDCSCELLFVDAITMQDLNNKTRNIDKVTDVLSYPTIAELKDRKLTKKNYFADMEEDRLCIGSIVICKEQMLKQAKEYGTTPERELYYLIVHGICHLLGFDHINEQDRQAMRAYEERLLQALGLSQTSEGI